MLDIEPFCGIRYNLDRITDPSLVITPPYDVISPGEQQLYYRRSPYNVVRLELGEELPSDSPQDNKYTRADSTLKSWLKDGILIRDEHPSFYIFQHRFSHRGVLRNRWGLTARVRIQDWSTGDIRPHEVTFREYTTDRLNLLQACRVNLSPVFGIIRSKDGSFHSLLSELAVGEPVLSAEDNYGVTHSMWIINGETELDRIHRFCTDRTLYIADGHHRYETALAYQKEQRAACISSTGNEAFNFAMMTLTDWSDPGLLILPSHRLIKFPAEYNYNAGELEERLKVVFHMEELPRCSSAPAGAVERWMNALEERGEMAIGLYGLRGENLLILVPQNKHTGGEMLTSTPDPTWSTLGLGILHRTILGDIIRIDDSAKEEECIEYTRDALEAISMVDSGKHQLAFLLNPIPIASVLETADAGDRMPQKSTHFYPKPPTGLVMNPLWDEE